MTALTGRTYSLGPKWIVFVYKYEYDLIFIRSENGDQMLLWLTRSSIEIRLRSLEMVRLFYTSASRNSTTVEQIGLRPFTAAVACKFLLFDYTTTTKLMNISGR